MTQESRLGGFPESVHGVDYLFDYYQIIGIDKDASPANIKKAWQIIVKQYHPDRFQGLAPELASQAMQKTKVLIEADQVLSDPQKKKEYDEKLANWTGPISKSGLPIIVLSASKLSHASITGNLEEQKVAIEQTLKRGAEMVGFDQATFSVIEEQYKSTENPSPQLKKAYREMLAKKDTSISLQEILFREAMGIKTKTDVSTKYLTEVTTDLTKQREVISREVADLVLNLTGEEVKLLSTGENPFPVEFAYVPTKAVDHYTQIALEKFDEVSQTLKDLASEREELINERLRVLEGEYLPNAENIFDNGIIQIIRNSTKSHFSFKIDGASVNLSRPQNEDALQKMTDQEIEKLIEGNQNFIRITSQDGLPLMDELTTVIAKHVELLEKGKKAQKED